LIFLGINAPLPLRPTPPPTPTIPAPSTTTPVAVQNAVSINSICRLLGSQLGVGQLSEADLDEQIARALDDLKFPPGPQKRLGLGPQAKLIVTFGYAESVGAGERLAERVNARFAEPMLGRRLGNLLTAPSSLDVRSYGIASRPTGQVSIELFVAYDGPLPAGAYASAEGCIGRPAR
jgi:hypothetical protein